MKLRESIITTLNLCKKELADRKNGIDGESTMEQLETIIIPELESLMNMIVDCSMPPKEDRYLISFANAFRVWGWDMQNPTELYVSLVRLNDLYKEYE